MTVRIIGVLPHDSAAWVGASGQLPTFETDTPPFWQDTELVNRTFADIIGSSVTVQRPAAIERVGDDQVRVYGLEAHGVVAGRWEHMSRLPDPVPGVSVVELARPLDDHPLAVPWYRPGWYASAVEWIRDQLGDRDVLSLSQCRAWGLSTLVKAETETGRFWFKANGPPFPDEVAKTVALAHQFPDVVPPVVAHDLRRGWVIFGDLGSESLNERLRPVDWSTAGAAYARMQVASIDRRAELERAGIPTYTDARIASDVESMVADDQALTSGPYGLDSASVDAVRRRSRGWVEAVHELSTLSIPLAVEHGDLHAGQMLFDAHNRVRVIDWSDVALANPVISLETFIGAHHRNLGPHLAADHCASLEDGFTDAFMNEWGKIVDPAVLRRGAELARQATAPLEALPYWRMVPKMEQPWEFENMVPHTLVSATV